jgi:hypothetical protein
MTVQAQADGIPPFWTEPWQWAAPAWRRLYGAPPREFDRRAERLIFNGWFECFGLPRQWRAPADPRWMHVVRAPPNALRGIASVLGYVALLRGGVSVALACRSPTDPWLALALKFRAINCLRANGGVACRDLSASYACGVDVLRAMAQCDWPDVDTRLAMLVAPDRFHPMSHENKKMQRMKDQPVALEWIDIGRCLSLCGSVTRHAAAQLASQGAQ